MTKKIFLPLAAALLCAGAASAQTVTPFTPRVTNEYGKRVYLNPQQNSKVSISMGYGFAPASSFNNIANKSLHYYSASTGTDFDGDISSTLGSIHLGVGWNITPWLELDFTFLFSRNWGTQEEYATIMGQRVDIASAPLRDNWWTLMTSVRVDWMKNNWLSLYSRVGAGISLANRTRWINNDLYSSSAFAWQVSPVGVEMGGKRVCWFLEAGYGFSGIATTGVKFKIGHVDQKTGKLDPGKERNWYDRYLQ